MIFSYPRKITRTLLLSINKLTTNMTQQTALLDLGGVFCFCFFLFRKVLLIPFDALATVAELNKQYESNA